MAGCRVIQLHNVAFKTFYSEYNRLPMVIEMLNILRPRRAEIWLVQIKQEDGQIRPYGEGFTGMESKWPFVVC